MSYKDSQKTSATIQVLVKVFPRWHHISAAKHRIFKLSLSVRLPSPARARMPSVYLPHPPPIGGPGLYGAPPPPRPILPYLLPGGLGGPPPGR